jgi:hypothetical protein
MTTLRDVYLYVFDEYLTDTNDVAIALFDERDDDAEKALEEISDAELIKRVGDDSWMATPNQESIERDEAVVNSRELDDSEIAVYKFEEANPVNPKPSYRHPDRALDNFTALVENAPTDAARAFWQAKLDTLDT